jgi:hypothetical protein
LLGKGGGASILPQLAGQKGKFMVKLVRFKSKDFDFCCLCPANEVEQTLKVIELEYNQIFECKVLI